MIYSIGTDIVEIERIRNAIKNWGDRFLKKVYTEKEIAYCMNRKDPFPNLAVRFAAKEAFIKAASSTEKQRKIINISDLKKIEILNHPSGKPFINLLGDLKEMFKDELISHLSLSHERNYALALVVLERKKA